ncbi:MAG TPA: SDR family oxidoreductase [Candidatus Moranbacteria bacterium]|nr:SDR family oxidoreductase [Candidatus Moranbacteria bacterium]
MNNSLQNKKIFIVGGSSGIGLAVSKQAYKLGASIIIASRNASEKHNDLSNAVGHSIETYSFNATSEDETEKTLKKIGNIDHLVITIRPDIKPAAFEKTDIKNAKVAFETKFWGQYQLIQKARNQIDRNGSIIMTTGIAGEKIFDNFSTMAIINSATETLCRSLAIELAPIRVNVVSPGFVGPKSEEVEKYAQQFPLRKLALPEEVAETYIFLMLSSYTTGTSMVIDGGARLI